MCLCHRIYSCESKKYCFRLCDSFRKRIRIYSSKFTGRYSAIYLAQTLTLLWSAWHLFWSLLRCIFTHLFWHMLWPIVLISILIHAPTFCSDMVWHFLFGKFHVTYIRTLILISALISILISCRRFWTFLNRQILCYVTCHVLCNIVRLSCWILCDNLRHIWCDTCIHLLPHPGASYRGTGVADRTFGDPHLTGSI